MPTVVILDALYPPSPDQLIRDLDAVGAAGAMVYCWRPGGIGNWTPAHVEKLHEAGKLAGGIVVPPGNGGAPAVFLDAVAAMGIRPGEPVGLDIEPPNTPPPAWEETFDAALKERGYVELDYGTQLELGLYQPDDNEWYAVWIRTGVLNPLPALPAGWQAWQFVNDIEINGSQYDASVMDASLWNSLTGGLDMATADQILDLCTRINTEVGYDASNPNGGITPNGVAGVLISGVAAIAAQVGVEEKDLAALKAKVDGLATPTLDPVAFAAALATHPLTSHLDDAERDAVAAHVITALAGQFGKA